MLNCAICGKKRGKCYCALYLCGQVSNHNNTHIVGDFNG